MRMMGPDNKEQISYYEYPTFWNYISDMTYIGNKINYRNKRQENININKDIQYVDIVRGSFMFF